MKPAKAHVLASTLRLQIDRLVPLVLRYNPAGDLIGESRREASDYEHKPGVTVNRDGEAYLATATTKASSTL